MKSRVSPRLPKGTIKALLYLGSMATCSSALAAIPAGYYDSVNASSAQSLRTTLHGIIDDHKRFPYTSSSTDTWDILETADQDPSNANNVIDIYKNASYAKAGGGNSFYNREHSWPKSYGFPKDGASNYPYTDAHHLFIANSSYNSSRSNKPYDNCTSGCIEKTTDYNNTRGGGAGESNWTKGSGATGSWQTWNGRKGDVARALMYLAVRYEGGTHSVTGVSEPDLILTDDRTLIANSNNKTNKSVAYMGLKSVLLQWHKDDPVDDFERRHNDGVYQHQKNRNPFVDHPEYVACVFESNCSGSGGSGGGTGGGGGSSSNNSVWINEFHYDDDGTDNNEFIELAGTAGINLSGWSLVAYNGNGGTTYKTVNLSGTIADQSNGYGTKSFSFSGLQNGAPDGFALVNSSGSVVQFLSYEGSFAATNGPASGQTSSDVGVAESNSTANGHSLQLSGNGTSYNDFNWQSAAANTAGSLNNGQSFGSGGTTTNQSLFVNNTTTAIPDNSSMTSNLSVQRSGSAGTVNVSVNISHTYRGDISLTLVAPDGSQYTLRANNGSDSADNIVETYSANVTGNAQGTWQLRVTDNYAQDTGQLNSWQLQF